MLLLTLLLVPRRGGAAVARMRLASVGADPLCSARELQWEGTSSAT